jgi:hypothetical protein
MSRFLFIVVLFVLSAACGSEGDFKVSEEMDTVAAQATLARFVKAFYVEHEPLDYARLLLPVWMDETSRRQQLQERAAVINDNSFLKTVSRFTRFRLSRVDSIKPTDTLAYRVELAELSLRGLERIVQRQLAGDTSRYRRFVEDISSSIMSEEDSLPRVYSLLAFRVVRQGGSYFVVPPDNF